MKLLKRLPIFIVLITVTTVANAQLGVGFYQSNMGSYANVNYQIERLSPELRIGTDNYFEDIHLEPVLNYQWRQKENYTAYVGVGTWVNQYDFSLIFPVGVNIYPFANKEFGFHIELAMLFVEGVILRGSWGIRYQFGN
jgi:hypothetical protein